MSYNLPTEKKIMAMSMLCEGSSIRSVERITGVHRDTIMRLGVRAGEACRDILDQKMRGLECRHVEVDEIWGFIGKKNSNVKPGEDRNGLGDVWTFIALDEDTKVIPSFVVGKRDAYHAKAFMDDLAGRMTNRVQLSSDALTAYAEAVERGFGSNVATARS